MKPTAFVLLFGVTLIGAGLSAPLQAQSGQVSVSGRVAVTAQYPQGPPAGGYGYPQRQGSPPYAGGPGNGGARGNGYGFDDYAVSTGYRDGYEQGFDASRDRDRFDPRRERWYHSGDRGYKRDANMSRDRYKDFYRRGFLNGYEAGYRDAQRGYRGGGYGPQAPRNGWGIWR